MTVAEVLNQIKFVDGKVESLSSGKVYSVDDFVNSISNKLKFTKKQKNELASYFVNSIKAPSEQSSYVAEVIEKYNFQFSDGIYIVNDNIVTVDEIYRLMWKEEKLLPTEVDSILENIEKISEPIPLQERIFQKIVARKKVGKSAYLQSLYDIYPNIKWKELIFNIIVPFTKPMFHIFYDDGIGGTGKSTLLEVLTKIVGEGYTSNVLLDQFGNRFIFSNMLGKYLNVGDDNGKNDELQNVGTLKSIITGNRVTIDRKNINPIEVRIFAKQLFATNILPYIDFTDGGIMRRLNIVPMNKVIKKDRKMPIINEDEIGKIIYEVLESDDLKENRNELAIINNPLYRFYITREDKTYEKYKSYCSDYGFRQMNIINFETKSKFIKAHIDKNKLNETPEKLPF